jgi:superfamily II DNA/RNA helicase
MDIEQNFDDMEEGAEFIKETDIDIKNVKSREALSKSMRESMLEVFCQKEIRNGKIPQTMIFSKSKADATGMLTADNIRKEVIKIMKLVGKTLEIKLPTGKSLVRVVTSVEGDSDVDFEDFRNCKFPILIVVGMAKEGFDAPKTEVAIDFNFNVKNLRDMEQKIGRLLRISEGKYVARYYYPDIFENYLKVNNRKMQSNSEGKKDIENAIESMNEGAVSNEVLEAVESAVRTQALALDVGAMEEGERDDKISLDAVEILNQIKPGGDRRMVVTSTSLVLDGAYNGNPLKNLYIKGLFDKVEEVAGQNEDYSTIKKLREAFERLCV